jgi:hypothetical protein
MRCEQLDESHDRDVGLAFVVGFHNSARPQCTAFVLFVTARYSPT